MAPMEHHANARDWQTRIRLWAALVIGLNQLFVMTYYSLGLVSSEAMEAFLVVVGPLFLAAPAITVALLVHASLGLWKLYRRNTLKMPLWEVFQIALGLSLLFINVPYNLAGLVTAFVFHLTSDYVDTVLLSYPDMAWRYVAMALVIGAHAHIGTHAVLRLRPWYPRVKGTIIVVFTLLPLAASLGYLNSGYQLDQAYQAGRLDPQDQPHVLTTDQRALLGAVDQAEYWLFAILIAGVFGARALRLKVQEKRKTVRVDYPNGRQVQVFPSTTVLEASRIGGIPHASICGGRGRCTTCRVKVEAGMENLSVVGDRERKALQRIGAAADIRLACQAEGRLGTIRVTPLLPPDFRSASARRETKDSVGRDVELAVMFADLRGFTSLSENKFPYDVVYILNSYFQAMGKAIEAEGGKIDKFLGDGILAYFGLDQDPRDACRNAVAAAVRMARDLHAVNAQLSQALPQGLSLGIGIHFGDVVLGEVGFHDHRQLTIIGDTVNTASRFEALNKQEDTQLVLSTRLAAQAGLDLSYLPVVPFSARGRDEVLRVYIVKDILAELEGTL